MTSKTQIPEGEVTIRTTARPADTNPDGDIFGGWLVCQMDMAAAVLAQRESKSRAVTVAIHALTFLRPVKVGDDISCYVKLLHLGRTSMKIQVDVWSIPKLSDVAHHVTTGVFVFVAVDEDGKPHVVKR